MTITAKSSSVSEKPMLQAEAEAAPAVVPTVAPVVAAPAPAPAAEPPCKFRRRRGKGPFRRCCCCIALLLIVHMLAVLHVGHMVGALAWFGTHGSLNFRGKTFAMVPGGPKTLCNSLCVDMCVYQAVECELKHCLNVCNENLEQEGNHHEFTLFPEDEPESPKEVQLDTMKKGIEETASKVRALKKLYRTHCAATPNASNCAVSKESLKKHIAALKEAIEKYDKFAGSIHVEVRAQFWLHDQQQITADP